MTEIFHRLLLVFSIISTGGTAFGAVFNDLVPGTRAAGMGMAYTAVSDDLNALYYNPAGLAKSQFAESRAELGRQVSPIGMAGFYSFSYARPLPILPGATVGTGLFRLRQADVGEKTSFLLHFSHSLNLPQFYLRKPLQVGGNVKLVQVKPRDGRNKVSLGADAGVLLDLGWDIRTGISLTDLTPDLGVDNPSLNLGVSYRWMRRVTAAADIRVRPNLTQVFPGVEVDFFQRLLRVRVGKGLPLDGVSGIVMGVGAYFSPLVVDFAMTVPWNGINRPGGGSMLSVGYRFGAPAFYGRFVGSAAREAEDLRAEILSLEQKKRDLEAEKSTAETERTSMEGRLQAEEERLRSVQEQIRTLEDRAARKEYDAGHPQPEKKPEPPPAPKPKAAPAAPAKRESPHQFPLRHAVQPGDTLRGLSQKYYGDPTLWETLYEANRDKVERGLPIEGTTLLVPEPKRR